MFVICIIYPLLYPSLYPLLLGFSCRIFGDSWGHEPIQFKGKSSIVISDNRSAVKLDSFAKRLA